MIWIYTLLGLFIGSACVIGRPLKVYSKGYNGKNLPPGGWTSWFNVDHPGGTGDYETIPSIVRHFGRGCEGIPCRKPIGIKAISVHWKTPFEEGDRVSIHPKKGLTCTDSHQSDHKCADYRVRFYCPGMHSLCHSKVNTTTESRNTHKTMGKKDKDSFKLSSKINKKQQENEIIKNTLKPKVKKKREKQDHPLVSKIRKTNGNVFNKHLFWNDRQTERRRAEEWIYDDWKKNDMPYASKWRNWK